MKAKNEEKLLGIINEAKEKGRITFFLDGNKYCVRYKNKSFQLFDESIDGGKAYVCSFEQNFKNLIYFIKKLAKAEIKGNADRAKKLKLYSAERDYFYLVKKQGRKLKIIGKQDDR